MGDLCGHRERKGGVIGWAGGYGRMVEIDHGNGCRPLRPSVGDRRQVGDIIKIGQVIGAVGSTGRSTGPHLHYETRSTAKLLIRKIPARRRAADAG